MRPQLDGSLIRRYLLGELPESEANSLEERYFADGEALEQVWAGENDLVDDYVAGRLTPEDRGRFERHYLASPRHRQRVAAARDLHAAARTKPRPRAVPGPRWSLAAAVLLALIAGWLWRSRSSEPPRTAAGPRPAPTSAPLPSPSPGPRVLRPTATLAFALSPTLVRGASPQPPLRIAPGTDEVLLQLEKDGGEASGERGQLMTATVRTVEGTSSWTGPARAPEDPARANLLATVRLPAARLPPGDYILTLSTTEGGEDAELHKYYFRVVP